MLSWIKTAERNKKMENTLAVKPIAYIKNDFPSKFGIPRQSGIVPTTGKIIFEKEFRDGQALREIRQFSHIWLIWGFSQNENASWSHTVRPPKLGGNKRVGVFATRSPFRPNPLGLSCVKIEEIGFDKSLGPFITVSGADLADETPIYDIKPYIAYTDSHPEALCGFSKDAQSAKLAVVFEDGIREKIDESKLCVITDILSQDPHPAYKKDKNRVYYMEYSVYKIGFTAEEEKITVVSCEKNK